MTDYSPHQMIGAGASAPAGRDQRNIPLDEPGVPDHTGGSTADVEQAVANCDANRERSRAAVLGVPNMSDPGTHTAT